MSRDGANGKHSRTYLTLYVKITAGFVGFVIIASLIASRSTGELNKDNRAGAVNECHNTAEGSSTPSMYHDLFSKRWIQEFAKEGYTGCTLGRGSYVWRSCGLGSNINNLLSAWVHALAVEGWSDMAIIIGSDQMRHISCRKQSGGQASTGWGCLFSPMPHLCTFPSYKRWTHHLVSNRVCTADRQEATSLNLETIRRRRKRITGALEHLGTDYFAAQAAMAKFLWSYVTPWLKHDVNAVMSAPETEGFKKWPFVGLHIRRGDKVRVHETEYFACEEYLKAAVGYLEGGSAPLSAEDIRGIWVASDDPGVLEEVRLAATNHFPNVDNSTVVWGSGGVTGGPDPDGMNTRTEKQFYAQVVYLIADLQQLTRASVFVGTFSSNVGKLVAVLRESLAMKDRDSVVNLDRNAWTPDRRMYVKH